MDPRGLFFTRTTEFDGRSLSLKLVVEVRPVVDTIFVPGAVKVNMVVYGSGGEPLPNQSVLLRPTLVTLEANWTRLITTNSKGMISPELLPGEYTVAGTLAGKVWEAPIRVEQSKCAKKLKKCTDSTRSTSGPSQIIAAHLSAVNE
jgi:hypothetical protein